MIWLAGALLVIFIGIFITAPFLTRTAPAPLDDTNEVAAYRAELQNMAADDPARAALEQRLLKASRQEQMGTQTRSFRAKAVLVSVGLLAITLGIYSQIGQPNFTPEKMPIPSQHASQDMPDMASLIPKIEARLAQQQSDPRGWHVYARALMMSGQYEKALPAYEKAIALSNNNPEFIAEYEEAKRYIANVGSGPSAADISAAQNMSEADRAEMIKGMVEGLRAKLDVEPNDPNGWARLLRSRQVLKQSEELKQDIEALRQALPQEADAIIAQAGISPIQ